MFISSKEDGPFMVVVLCPLCNIEVDLGVEASGEYECPYCAGSFEYESESLDLDQIEQYIDDIEAGIIEPDFVIVDDSYTDEVYWKVIRLLLSIPFIFLFGIGLIFIYFILNEPFETEHFVNKAIYNQKSDLILFYKTRNSILTEHNCVELADDAIINLQGSSSEEGGTFGQIICPSKDVNEFIAHCFIQSGWREFADYRGIRYTRGGN
jgi:hypothetical protein